MTESSTDENTPVAMNTLLRIHRELLQAPDMGPDDNFFDRGGNSILAFRLIRRTAEELGVRLSARTVFTAASVRELAERTDASAAEPTTAAAAASDGRASMAQEWAVLSALGDPDAPALQFHAAYRLRGPLEPALLEAALQSVVDHHAALRTGFEAREATVRQYVVAGARVELLVDELSWLPEGERPEEALRLLDKEVRRPFDRTAPPLFRAHLVRCADDDHFLALVFDHMAADGWSLDVLTADLATAYRALAAGERPRLSASGSYADWSALQWDGYRKGRGEEVARYWRDRLGPDPAALELRLPGYLPDGPLHDPASLEHDVPASVVAALDALCARLRTTPYVVTLAALKALVALRTGRSRVTLLTSAANRLEPGFQDTVGWFANGVFPTTDVDLSRDFGHLVAAVRETALAATAHGDLPAAYVRALMWPGTAAGNGGFRKSPGVYFMFNDVWGGALRLGGTRAEPVFLPETADSPGLHLWMLRHGPQVRFTALYYRSEYPDAVVRNFARDFLAAVQALAARPDLPVREVLASGRPSQRQERHA
ncbi:condensation domain-containing protein [Streptomyces sp. NPDC006355]|uniref:condensation domain-containing protein n=1 Tax=Streptomyces sp. NPDC006355 TaxID=3156758 RepID=UPI0033A3D052